MNHVQKQNGPLILVLADMPGAFLAALAARGRVLRNATAQDHASELRDCEIAIVRSPYHLDGSLMTTLPKLRWVIRAGTGLDNIDVPSADARGIAVYTAPVSAPAVAELAIGLLLACARSIPRLDASMKRGAWLKPSTWGTSLSGKTALVVGYGRVGRRVARAAAGLDMNVLVVHRSTEAPSEQDPTEAIPMPSVTSLDDGLPIADVLILCCPLTDETRGLISRKRISRLPLGALVINVARGGIVDQDALLEALDSGRLAGVGLDVHEVEPPGYTPLLGHENVVATPHVGAQTVQMQDRIMTEVIRILDGTVLPAWLRTRVTG